jgi:hypothetical protein
MIRQFKLSNKENESAIKFLLHYSFSYIKITRVDVNSLMGLQPNEWSKKLFAMELYFLFTYTTTYGRKISFPVSLSAQVSPTHYQPILLFDNLIVPNENKGNFTSMGEGIKNLTIELKSYNTQQPFEVELTVYVEPTPGIEVS